MDTADSLTFNGGNLEISSISPSSTPGVSDDPVVLSSFGSVSDSTDGVIEVGSTLLGVEDSGGVHLEDHLVGLDGEGNWGLGKSSLKLGDGLSGDVGISGILNVSGSEGFVASSGDSVTGAVWVVGLGVLSVGLEVSESVGLKSTVATHGVGVAGDEFLLGKRDELSSLEEVSTLVGEGGGESPA